MAPLTHRLVLAVLIAFASLLTAQEPRCSFSAQQCDRQIRQMLSGRRFLGLTIEEQPAGLTVTAVVPNSPAARAHLLAGDRLVGLNGRSLARATPREFKQILADARETGRIWMIVLRGGAYHKVETRLEPYSKQQIDKIVAAHMAQSHGAPGSN